MKGLPARAGAKDYKMYTDDYKNCNRCKFGLNYDEKVQVHCMKCLQGIINGFQMKPENWFRDKPAPVKAEKADVKKTVFIPIFPQTPIYA